MKLTVEKFLKESKGHPVIDVRTPAEFEAGHIPGAYNIPLLSNEGRAVVGTLYKHEGKERAFIKALELTGPEMANFVRKAKEISQATGSSRLYVYCWRGGMRSGSMSWLFNTAGFESHTLEGGYKAYRAYIRNNISKSQNIIILGGYTGSGKTEILKEIGKRSQAIDLEGIAHHKGSAFGFIGQEKQPTSEHFENILGYKWLDLDISKPIWLEDESRNIGSVYLPENLYAMMRDAPVIFLDVDKEIRIKRLIKEYAVFDTALLQQALDKIYRRIGGDNHKKATEALKNRDFYTVADITLSYYDKAYLYGLNKRNKNKIFKLNIDFDDPKKAAEMVLEYYEFISPIHHGYN